MHQVGFPLHDYIEMHGQQNIKKKTFFVGLPNFQSVLAEQLCV